MTAQRRARRCVCGHPATHRLKGGISAMQKLWRPQGEHPFSIPVNLPSLCGRCARNLHRSYGGRIYRWRSVRGVPA